MNTETGSVQDIEKFFIDLICSDFIKEEDTYYAGVHLGKCFGCGAAYKRPKTKTVTETRHRVHSGFGGDEWDEKTKVKYFMCPKCDKVFGEMIMSVNKIEGSLNKTIMHR